MTFRVAPGSTGPVPHGEPEASRLFWARPSFGAEPIPPGSIQLFLRWAMVAIFVIFVAAGEANGASRLHIALAGASLAINAVVATALLLSARLSPGRTLRAWALIIPADIVVITLAASIDHRNPTVIPTIALASVFNASVMFRSRDVLALGLLAAAGVALAVLPRNGVGGITLETLLQALITLSVTGFAITRGRSEESLRRTLLAAQSREREQNEALQGSQAQLRLAMAAGRIGPWEVDLAVAPESPRAGAETFADRAREAFGLALNARYSSIHPDDRAKLEEGARLAVEGTGPFEIECRFIAPTGVPVQWLHVAGDAIRSESGDAIRLVGVVMDVTKNRELQQQLVQAQRMEAVGHLAAGVAHDFNNILTAVIGYNSLAARALDQDHPAQREIEESTHAATRAADLTRQLLAFGRRGEVRPGDVDLNELLGGIERMLQRVIGEEVDLRFRSAPVPLVCRIDPAQFEQVIVNLAVNARDAMPTGGVLAISARLVTLDGPCVVEDMTPGEYALVEVTDTGSGIPEDILEHIFEPFFTTKALGKGSGLGLATCHGIVEQVGGHIAVVTRQGHGTTFKIYLPLAASRGREPKPMAMELAE